MLRADFSKIFEFHQKETNDQTNPHLNPIFSLKKSALNVIIVEKGIWKYYAVGSARILQEIPQFWSPKNFHAVLVFWIWF